MRVTKIMPTQTDNKTVYSSGELAILEAAECLFADKGFDAVSMSAIAKLANTSKPNIYHHFKNKDELYLSIMKKAVQRTSALLDALEDSPGTFRQRLTDFSAGHLENVLSHTRSSQLILREALSGNSERGREIAKHVVGTVFSRLIAMIQQGQQDSEFRKHIDPTLAAFLIVSANMFFFQAKPVIQQISEVQMPDDAATYSKGVMDILLNGLLQHGEDPS
jgi:TetR/AcrR family transcriptional regulator